MTILGVAQTGKEYVALGQYSTMRTGGVGRWVVEVKDELEVQAATEWAKSQKVEWVVIGGGSNILWQDEGYEGLIIVNRIKGLSIDSEGMVRIGAGEEWDEVVRQTVKAGWSGIEALSLIPGTAGATPVQNVGAYGQDISQTVRKVRAYDARQQRMVELEAEECQFGYRDSLFKRQPGRYVICEVMLQLHAAWSGKVYPTVELWLKERGLLTSPSSVRQAVRAIRQAKLPDPAEIGNCGSFFGNPVVAEEAVRELEKQYGQVAHWAEGKGQVKIAAAWLIEQAGYKNWLHRTGLVGTWPGQPLVLVNYGSESSSQVLQAAAEIEEAVWTTFGVRLVREPVVV